MSEGSPKSSLTDAMQRLSKTVDKTVKYIQGQRAQNKTQKATIQKHQALMVHQTQDLIKSQRDEIIAKQYLPFADTVYNYTHFLQQNDFEKKKREIRTRQEKELQALYSAIEARELDSSNERSESEEASQQFSEYEDQFEQVLANYDKEKSKRENTQKEYDKRLAAKQEEEDRKKQNERAQAEAQAILDAETTRKETEERALAEAEAARIESEARTLQEAEAARVKAEEDRKKAEEDAVALKEAQIRKALADEEDRKKAEHDIAEAIRVKEQQRIAEEERRYPLDFLKKQVLQLLLYYACPNPPEGLKWGEGQLAIDEKNKVDWYSNFIPLLDKARDHYNNESRVKMFLVIREGSGKPLTTFDENFVTVNIVGTGRIPEYVLPSGKDAPQVDYPKPEVFPNHFTAVSSGTAVENFATIRPKLIETDGRISTSRSYSVFGPSGSGKTTQVAQFLEDMCTIETSKGKVQSQVRFCVVQLYGVNFPKKKSELYLFNLTHRSTNIIVQPDDKNLPSCPTSIDARGKITYNPYELLDQRIASIDDARIYQSGTFHDIFHCMNSGVFKQTPNNDESSRGMIFIKLIVPSIETEKPPIPEKTYYICDFPGSEVNIEQMPTHLDPNISYLVGESTFFKKALLFCKNIFQDKKNKTHLNLNVPLSLTYKNPPLVQAIFREWFNDRNVAMVFTALGNYGLRNENVSLTRDQFFKQNHYKFLRSTELIQYLKTLDTRERCVPFSEARAYFGDENMVNPIVRSMIQPSSEGGSKKKITRKRYGTKNRENTRRTAFR